LGSTNGHQKRFTGVVRDDHWVVKQKEGKRCGWMGGVCPFQ